MKFSTSACVQVAARSLYVKLFGLIAVSGIFLILTGCGGAAAANANTNSGVDSGQSNPTNSSSGTQNPPAQQPSNPPVQQPPDPPDPPPPPPPPPPSHEPPSAPSPPPNAKTTSAIQTMDGWTWCTAKLHGQTCASGEGNAESSMTAKQKSPSLSGSSSVFWIGGKTRYSNALWWRELGPDSDPRHFNYDLYFYMDDPGAPEALEFDVNQTINGTRFVFGTECSYRNTKHWDIWDTARGKWVETNVDCPQVKAKKWHHLVWHFERVGNQAHYIGVTVDDTYTVVDKYFDPAKYGSKGISVAVQLDGDHKQTPYKLWIDKLDLILW